MVLPVLAGTPTGGGTSVQNTTAARAQLIADRQAAKQAANGQVNAVSAPPSSPQISEAESQLNEGERFKAEQLRMRVEHQRDDNDAEDNELQTQENDPVSRLKQLPKQAEKMILNALDDPALTERGSDAVTAAIQGAGFTSLTIVDFGMGLIVSFPLTIIQFLITLHIIQPPQAGTKMKVAYDMLDYHFWSGTGPLKVQGGLMVLFMGFVSLTLLLALFLVVLLVLDLIPGIDIMGIDLLDTVTSSIQIPTP